MLQTVTSKTAKHDATKAGAIPTLTSIEIRWSVRAVIIDDDSRIVLTNNIDDHAELVWRFDHLKSQSARVAMACVTSADSEARTAPVTECVVPAGAIFLEDGLMHIELASTLSATLRIAPSAATASQLLYARTNIFTQLELPGAMYEVAGVQIDAPRRQTLS